MPSTTACTAKSLLRPLGLAAAAMLAIPALASAATITVTSTADDGAGSLRAAVAAAAGGDTIQLPAGIINLTSGPIATPRLITILGPGARRSTIIGNHTSRLFTVGIGSNLTLSGTTLTGGTADTGAAILAQGELHVSDIDVADNQATGSGGAIAATAGPITIDRSTFRGNSAAADGGALLFAGTGQVAITNATFASNSAGGHGGVYATQNVSPEASVTLTNDTFLSNRAGAGASSGPVMSTAPGTVSGYRNSVFSDNGDVCEYGTSADGSPGVNVSDGYNVFDGTPGPACNLRTLDGVNHDHVVTNVLLSSLADHGGGTDTAMPLAGSPVIGEGYRPQCPQVDQRGVARPDASCDAGAVQVSSGAGTTPTPTKPISTCTVPKTNGLTPPKARSALRNAGCRVGASTAVHSSSVKRGRVVGTTPAAGRKVATTTAVTLRISKG